MDDYLVSLPLVLCSLVLVIGLIGVGKATLLSFKMLTLWTIFVGSEGVFTASYYLRVLWLPMEFWPFLQFLYCLVTIGMLVFGLLRLNYEKNPT